MNRQKLCSTLSLALAAGLLAVASAAAQEAEPPAARGGKSAGALRRAPAADTAAPQAVSPQDLSRPRRARPAREAGRRREYPGMETRRARRGPRRGEPARPGTMTPRMRMLLQRIGRMLMRNPELVPRLEQWVSAHEGATPPPRPGMERGVREPGVERGRPVRRGRGPAPARPGAGRLPPGTPPPAEAPPAVQPERRGPQQMERSRRGAGDEPPARPGNPGRGRGPGRGDRGGADRPGA